MTNAESFRALIDYHYALYDRVWESISTLTDEQFVVEAGYAHGSLRNQMVHVAQTDRRWLWGILERPEARQLVLNPADYPGRLGAVTLWRDVEQEFRAYAAGLDDAELQRQPRGMPGPVWQVLAHVVNHGTDHRAQVLRILHDLGAPTFDQDLILHLWRR